MPAERHVSRAQLAGRNALGASVLTAAALSCGGGAGTSSATSASAATGSSAAGSTTGVGGAQSSSVSSSATGSTTAASGTGGALPTGTRVRIVAANLSSGTVQSYDAGHGARILEGIRGDVLLMQELNVGLNTDSDFTSLVETICGMDCTYVRGPGTQQIPNAIVTRYPVVASGSWVDANVQNRDFVWAHLDIPGAIDLWAISVHLLTSNPIDRAAEGAALMSLIDANVPVGDFVVLGGDFNTKVRDEPVLMNLDPRFVVEVPYPADQSANDQTSGNRSRPYDWLLATDGLRARQLPVVIGSSTFPSGAVIDTRVYQPLTEIAPALIDDSGAPNMQHMAVVKDFAFE